MYATHLLTGSGHVPAPYCGSRDDKIILKDTMAGVRCKDCRQKYLRDHVMQFLSTMPRTLVDVRKLVESGKILTNEELAMVERIVTEAQSLLTGVKGQRTPSLLAWVQDQTGEQL